MGLADECSGDQALAARALVGECVSSDPVLAVGPARRPLGQNPLSMMRASAASAKEHCGQLGEVGVFRFPGDQPRAVTGQGPVPSLSSSAMVVGRSNRSNSAGSANSEMRVRWVRVQASTTIANGW